MQGFSPCSSQPRHPAHVTWIFISEYILGALRLGIRGIISQKPPHAIQFDLGAPRTLSVTWSTREDWHRQATRKVASGYRSQSATTFLSHLIQPTRLPQPFVAFIAS